MENTCFRSSKLGRSTKKSSSKRPLRINSGGRTVTLLQVAATKTADFRSCTQARKEPQQSRRPARIGRGGIGAASGEDFFQLIDPQHARGEALGNLEYFLNSLFRLAYEFVVHGGGIELHQRQLPFPGYGAGAETLAASLDPENDDPLRRIEAELEGAVVPRAAALLQPVLQIVEAANAGYVVG